ncbi:Proteasome subunit alpha type-2 [Binucleata daphniae]
MNFIIDHSLTTFTSEGKLDQCEYALKAAQNGTLSIGVHALDGVVLSSLKKFPKLVEKEKMHKVNKICTNIGITYSGLTPDYRIIYENACVLVEGYKQVYGRYPYIDIFVHNLSRVLQEYTQKEGLRPFGVVLLLAGYAKKEAKLVPEMYSIEPSGGFRKIDVCAIGRENENAHKFVSSRKEMVDDNIVGCVHALREFSGIDATEEDTDIGILRNGKFEILQRNEVKEIFDSYISK